MSFEDLRIINKGPHALLSMAPLAAGAYLTHRYGKKLSKTMEEEPHRKEDLKKIRDSIRSMSSDNYVDKDSDSFAVNNMRGKQSKTGKDLAVLTGSKNFIKMLKHDAPEEEKKVIDANVTPEYLNKNPLGFMIPNNEVHKKTLASLSNDPNKPVLGNTDNKDKISVLSSTDKTSPSVVLHEIGHATRGSGKKTENLVNLTKALYPISSAASGLPMAMAVSAFPLGAQFVGKRNPQTASKFVKSVTKGSVAANLALAASSIPLLAEEHRAWSNARKLGDKMGVKIDENQKKNALGTYYSSHLLPHIGSAAVNAGIGLYGLRKLKKM